MKCWAATCLKRRPVHDYYTVFQHRSLFKDSITQENGIGAGQLSKLVSREWRAALLRPLCEQAGIDQGFDSSDGSQFNPAVGACHIPRRLNPTKRGKERITKLKTLRFRLERTVTNAFKLRDSLFSRSHSGE